MNVKVRLAAILSLMAMVSCGMDRSVSSEEISGKEWTLNKCEVAGKELEPGFEAPVLMFNDSVNISGSTGCNRIMGNYELRGDSLYINIIGTTRMACPNMEFENKYLQIMKVPMAIELDESGKEMILENKANQIKLVYKEHSKAVTTGCGGDTDVHGCKGSAGYTWSELRKDCIRIFEEGIRLNPASLKEGEAVLSSFIVFSPDSVMAELFIPSLEVAPIANSDGKDKWKTHDGYVVDKTGNVWTISKEGKILYSSAVID